MHQNLNDVYKIIALMLECIGILVKFAL